MQHARKVYIQTKKKNQAIKRQWWEIKTSLEPRTLRQGASRDLSKS